MTTRLRGRMFGSALVGAVVFAVTPLEAQRGGLNQPVGQTREVAEVERAPAARGLSAAELQALQAAYQTALRQPTVRRASQSEIRRQLHNSGPVAAIPGYWVTAIDMSPVYRNPSVRTHVAAALPQSGTTLSLNELLNKAMLDQLTALAFIQADVARTITPGLMAEARDMGTALNVVNSRTDLSLGAILVFLSNLFGLGIKLIDAYNEYKAEKNKDAQQPTSEETPQDPEPEEETEEIWIPPWVDHGFISQLTTLINSTTTSIAHGIKMNQLVSLGGSPGMGIMIAPSALR